MQTENNTIYSSIIIACILGIITVSALILTNPKDDGFTELYFLDYTKVPEKNTVTFKYGIANHEKENIDYNIRFLTGNQTAKNKRTTLKDNETFIEEYTLPLDSRNPGNQKISIEISYQNKTQEIHFITRESPR
ncbi:MAG: DUF1616 domain-containing protein [archaeon]|nr:DUF1616 domain-containing protein [archaeon]